MHGVQAHAQRAQAHVVGHRTHAARLEVHGGGGGEGLGEGVGVRHHVRVRHRLDPSLQNRKIFVFKMANKWRPTAEHLKSVQNLPKTTGNGLFQKTQKYLAAELADPIIFDTSKDDILAAVGWVNFGGNP